MCVSIHEVKKLLHYEIRSSTRYRRFISLLIIDNLINKRTHSKTTEKFHRLLEQRWFRESDEAFLVGSQMILLLGETCANGAMKVVERIQDPWNGNNDYRISVTSFPSDGNSVDELLSAAQRRLLKALSMGKGAIVNSG